jgi:hypothetical protein
MWWTLNRTNQLEYSSVGEKACREAEGWKEAAVELAQWWDLALCDSPLQLTEGVIMCIDNLQVLSDKRDVFNLRHTGLVPALLVLIFDRADLPVS